MPFDSTKPVNGVLIDADFLRGQFNALKDLIDAAPTITAVVVDAVNTLPAGSLATVDASITGTVLHLTFGIPDGPSGADGQQGPPGEVSAVQLNDSIAAALVTATANSSANTNAVATLDTAFTNDPPTLADMETMRAAHNALVLSLRR
ncbi:MAG: hypothetical protein ABI318_10880 [Chthoniobacteraceae bacterium]